MNDSRTPISDGILRARYGLPDDFDFGSLAASPFSLEFSLEQIAAELKRKAEAERQKEAARQKEIEALQPPKVTAQFLKTPSYLKGERRVAGVASTGAINSKNVVHCPGGAIIILPVPLLVNHDLFKCLGSVEGAQIDDEGKISVWANLDSRCDANTWRRIRSGELGCFSVGVDTKTLPAPVNLHGIDHYFAYRLKEISLCESGANHECIVTEIWPTIAEGQPSEETAVTGKADLAQSVAELADTLRLPVKPIYDKDGKLIGAQRVDKAFEQFEARLAAVESRPATLYRGIWSVNEGYYAVGEQVTCKGSLWTCREPTRSKPGEDASWQLTVKKNRA